MQILCHRGTWQHPDERNTLGAMARSFELGLGVETDIRDAAGVLVVSHDPPTAACPTLDELLALHAGFGADLPLALNVKADGLAPEVARALASYTAPGAFAFDMSVPDTLGYVRSGVPVFTRHSELEPEPALYERAAGVWLDAFVRDWFDAEVVRDHLDAGKRVAIVSPELHGRPHERLWRLLATSGLAAEPAVALCTDLPAAALAWFHVEQARVAAR